MTTTSSNGGMPSIKKAVYGIFRQLSSNSVAPSSNNGHATDDPSSSEEFIRDSASSASNSVSHKVPYDPRYPVIAEVSKDPGPITNGIYVNCADQTGKIHQESPNNRYRNNYESLNSHQENGKRDLVGMEQSFIHMYLSGRLKKPRQPEIYYGKTGVDLPVFQIVPLNPNLFASYTGPDGGLTQVPCVTRRPLANIANLDDELNLSFDADLNELSTLTNTGIFPSPQSHRRAVCMSINNVHPPHRTQSLNSNGEHDTFPVAYETKLDWSKWHDRAYGLATSLYECHPITKIHAGNPVADVFAVCARRNSCILALADGVNWGEKSRLAARCAIRGAVEHLDDSLYNSEKPVKNTLDIFHCLLGAFHTGHQLILQETGALTTLCVVVVTPLKGDTQWAVCACNVGDSLAFVYSEKYGVREVTFGSHDIQQMRDMRDAGGALGPVDGVNPELHNMTCSMTTVDAGDIVFITSDGVSDNFDPVVGKFCIIRDENSKAQMARKHRETHSDSESHSVKSPKLGAQKKEKTVDQEDNEAGSKVSHLPVVEAYQRHELMLLRMEDLLRHGVTLGDPSARTARDLCENLINFATQLTMAKRKILEDPELYQGENRLSQRDQRLRRKHVRQRISEMPGKLDHATVVAYMVGEKISPSASIIDEESGESSQVTPRPAAEADDKIDEDEEPITIETNELYESSDDTVNDTPQMPRRDAPVSTAIAESTSSLNTPTSPTLDLDIDVTIIYPPLPTEPLPVSSSSDEEGDWTDSVDTVRGPFEPDLNLLIPADGLVNHVRMIDESSVSSLSGCGNTPVPPSSEDEEAIHDRLCDSGMQEEDLATPAQEYPLPWPVVEAPQDQPVELHYPKSMLSHNLDENASGLTQDHKSKSASEILQEHMNNLMHSKSSAESPQSVIDSESVMDQSRPSHPNSLALDSPDDWRVDVNVDLNSPEDTCDAFGSISISSVLECCNLIIKDTDEDKSPIPISKSDQPEQREALTPLDENDVVDIFAAHGVPLSARRWPPPPNRAATSKCASLPAVTNSISDKINSMDMEHSPAQPRLRASELRSQRSLMNESYYMATSTDEPSVGMNSATNTLDRGSTKMSSGRFGKLTKAFDRLERAVTGRRKHGRGSPHRHTVATDNSQWSEMKAKSAAVAMTPGKGDHETASPSKRHSGSSHTHLAWSPVRAFRALTSPRRQSSAASSPIQPPMHLQIDKKPESIAPTPSHTPALQKSTKNIERKSFDHHIHVKVNVVDTTADVIVENPIESVHESVTYIVPHSASDTEIVVRISATLNAVDSGKESAV